LDEIATAMKTPEQEARDLLNQYGVERAQAMTSGDVVELANFINHAWAWRKAHGRCPHGSPGGYDCSRCKQGDI
jgi:hypothetical protein